MILHALSSFFCFCCYIGREVSLARLIGSTLLPTGAEEIILEQPGSLRRNVYPDPKDGHTLGGEYRVPSPLPTYLLTHLNAKTIKEKSVLIMRKQVRHRVQQT